MTITQAIDRTQAMYNGVDVDVAQAMKQTEDIAIGLNQDQMYAGLRSDGSEISPFYTTFTIREKRKKGQPTDRVTLYDLGNFYNRMYLDIQGAYWSVKSRDYKFTDLVKKYGERIMGLSDLNKNEWAVSFRPVLIRNIAAKYKLPIKTA
jgi:hypothetical protein